MARRHLGKTIDIHAGGEDLIFPHHENEIAQSECANGCTFARYWMHNGFLNIDNHKMSKSANNFFTVRELSEVYGYEPIRYFLLDVYKRQVTPIVRREDVALRGEHNLENLLAAFTAVWGMAEVSTMAAVAKSFAGVEHRIEPVRTLNGVQWFNDSIATSPTRVIAGDVYKRQLCSRSGPAGAAGDAGRRRAADGAPPLCGQRAAA